jgi:tetratricopeptide (TPR) repeat protein
LARAIEIDPAFSWPYAVQATIAYQQGDLKSSRAAADMAIKQADSKSSERLNSRRARFQVDGRFQDAIRAEKEAIALEPKEEYRHRLSMYEQGKTYTGTN